MMCEGDGDEDVLIYKDNQESYFFGFLKEVIRQEVTKDLKIPEEDKDLIDVHNTTYGVCKSPFGILRIRIVEFLTDVFKIFCKDIFQTFADADLFNTLLFYFDHYPYHNILHQKVCDIIMTVLDKNIETQINTFLYNTKLVSKILDSANDGKHYTF